MDCPSSPREVSKGAEPGIGPSSRGLWLMGSGVDLALVQCAVMIETAGALEAVEEIAALDGVDLLFLGPVDLSLALGTTVAELLEAKGEGDPVPRILAAARRHGKDVAFLPTAQACTPRTNVRR